MEKYIYHYSIFGQVTDPNAYGGDNYNSNVYSGQTQTSTGDQGGEQQGGNLANTGFDVMVPVALGAVMIVASVAAMIKMRRGKKANA